MEIIHKVLNTKWFTPGKFPRKTSKLYFYFYVWTLEA